MKRICTKLLLEQGFTASEIKNLKVITLSFRRRQSAQFATQDARHRAAARWLLLCSRHIWRRPSYPTLLSSERYVPKTSKTSKISRASKTLKISKSLKGSKGSKGLKTAKVVDVRPVSIDDYYRIMRYLIFESSNNVTPPSFFNAAYSGTLESAWRKNLLLGVYVEQELKGYLSCSLDESEEFRSCTTLAEDVILRPKKVSLFDISFFEIFRDHRDQGIGRKAIASLASFVQSRYPKYKKITLCPKAEAIRFYKRCGFTMDTDGDMSMKI
jgi:ribosomal protein S18 acetylase RimI-like enzyme